jgi:CRISP-associated protein Cas1
MKKHLNTLFVTTQGAYLFKEGETIVVKVDGEIKLTVPIPLVVLFVLAKSVVVHF